MQSWNANIDAYLPCPVSNVVCTGTPPANAIDRHGQHVSGQLRHHHHQGCGYHHDQQQPQEEPSPAANTIKATNAINNFATFCFVAAPCNRPQDPIIAAPHRLLTEILICRTSSFDEASPLSEKRFPPQSSLCSPDTEGSFAGVGDSRSRAILKRLT